MGSQDNVHLGSLTVKQTLEFAAMIRMPVSSSPRDRSRRVASVARMLGLEG
ncbi:unnamed protein product, partial [Discosporangium mesarthrocarpum]